MHGIAVRLGQLFALTSLILFVECPVVARPMTLEDELRMEGIGRVFVSADARFVVFEQRPPYADAPNTGTLDNATDLSFLSKLKVVDMAEPTKREPLFEQAPDAGYWIGEGSPDGSKLAIYSIAHGEIRAGVFEFATKRLLWFAPTPNYSWLTQHPLWISSTELVFPAMGPGQQPDLMHRLKAAARIEGLWNRTFEGKEASDTVYVSDPGASKEPISPGPNKGGMHLVRIDVETGRVQELDQGDFYDLRPSPDGRYVAALRDAGLRDSASPTLLSRTVDQARMLRVVVFDLQGRGKHLPCKACNVVLGSLQWSADGGRLAFYTDLMKPMQFNARTQKTSSISLPSNWLACDPSITYALAPIPIGSDGLALLTPSSEPTKAQGSAPTRDCRRPDVRKDWVLVRADDAPKNLTADFGDQDIAPADENGKFVPLGVERDSLSILARGEVWRIDVRGARKRITDGQGGLALATAKQNEIEQQALGASNHFGRVSLHSDARLVIVDSDRGTAKTLREPSPEAEFMGMAKDTDAAVFMSQSEPGGTLLLVRDRMPPERITTINGHMADVAFGDRVRLTYSYAGTTLASCVWLPPDYKSTLRYPTIVFVYPDRASEDRCETSKTTSFRLLDFNLLSGHGYVVVVAAAPQRLIRTTDGPTRGLTPVVLAAADAAIAAGYADPNALGIMGFSQGNHSALQVITETTRFKAAVAGFGISDFASHYDSMALIGRTMSDDRSFRNSVRYEWSATQNFMGVKPWEDPERYLKNSPVFFADRVTTPLLLFHSDFDEFPLSQSDEMYFALERLGKQATYVTYWGEGHFPASPANVRDFWTRILSWYDEHLRPNDDHEPEPASH